MNYFNPLVIYIDFVIKLFMLTCFKKQTIVARRLEIATNSNLLIKWVIKNLHINYMN